MLSERDKGELQIHLAEYNALSEFQQDAKASCVRIAMYHNTGIILATTWVIQQINSAGSMQSALAKTEYLLPLVFALPVINAVLTVACAYQVYSFFCIARHFQLLRSRLKALVGGQDVLAYEDKFRHVPNRVKELSLLLDVMAGAMWFIIPVALAVTIAIGAPMWIGFPTVSSKVAYWFGTALSVVAGLYLAGVVALMIRTRRGRSE